MNLLTLVLIVHVCHSDEKSANIPSAVFVSYKLPRCAYLRAQLLHVCPSWERDPSSVALPEVSSIFSLLK